NQALKYLFSFICLIIPLLYWPPAFDAAGVPRQALLAVCAGLALTLYCIKPFRTSQVEWHPIIPLMLILLAWATLSYSWSVDTGSSQLWITQLASTIFLAVIASRLSKEDVLDYIIPITLISASFAAVIAIGQSFGFNPLSFRLLHSSTPSSTFINPNYAANYFDLITPAALAFLLLQPTSSKFMRWLAATAFAATLSCLIICQSRGSWLGLFVELIALAFVCLRAPEFRKLFIAAVRRNSRPLIIALAIVAGIIYRPLYHPSKAPNAEKTESILTMTADTSIMERLHVYQNALVGIADHPLLGVGYGAFIMGFSPYVDAVHPTGVTKLSTYRFMHSDPLQMFFELGLPGGLLSLAIYFLAIAMCWRIIRSTADNQRRFLGMGLFLALIASGAHASVDFPLHLPTSAFYFWLWIGLVTGLYLHIFTPKIIRLPRIMLVMAGTAGLVFTVYSTPLYAGYLKANRDVFTAMQNAIHRNCDAVFRYSDKAMNEFGRDHYTRFWYAQVYTYCNAPAQKRLAAMN
ncbi:MAG: O-antigen ligase family protein, partial [Gammaproteobacteria bacterium]